MDSGLSRVDIGLFMQILLGAAGETGGKDLFSFQPIGGPKLGRIRKIFFQFSVFPNVFLRCSFEVPNGFSQCSPSSQCVTQHVLHT